MPAWLVVTAHINDREALMASGYPQASAEALTQYGGNYLVRAPGGAVLEGEGRDGGSVIVSEWPDRAAALAFYNSPEYSAAKVLRKGLADISVTLVGT